MSKDAESEIPAFASRAQWIGVLARATCEELEAAWMGLDARPAYEILRRPEVGLVMVRGRAGGTGNPFNFGEMSVTRCAVRLSDGTTGHSYAAGRHRRKAELAAVFDALLQLPGEADLYANVIVPLSSRQAADRALVSRKAAATKVEFFTMVRGDNQQ